MLPKELYIPNFPRKLISLGAVANDGGEFHIGSIDKLQYQGITIPLMRDGSIFRLRINEANVTAMINIEWYERYGHLPFPIFKMPETPRTLPSSNINTKPVYTQSSQNNHHPSDG